MAKQRPLQIIPPDELFDQGIADLFEGSVLNVHKDESPDLPELQALPGVPTGAPTGSGKLPGVPGGNSGRDLGPTGSTPGGQG